MKIYLGLNPEMAKKHNAKHLPIIGLRAYSNNNPKIKNALRKFNTYSHIVLTSRASVKIFMTRARKNCGFPQYIMKKKIYILIGPSTIHTLMKFGKFQYIQPEISTSEGLIALMKQQLKPGDKVLYLHSARSRPLIKDYLEKSQTNHVSIPHYTAYPLKVRLPQIQSIKEIIFSSPSGIESFNKIVKGKWPPAIDYQTIGPITERILKLKLNKN